MFWLFFSLLVLLFAYFGEKSNTVRTQALFRVLLVIVLSYVTGFGGLVGQDHDNYAMFYHQYSSLASLKSYSFLQSFIGRGQQELLWTLMMIVGNLLGLGEAGFFFIVSVITNALFVYVFYKYPKPIFSVFLFIVSTHYFQEVNLVRQMLAIAVSLFGVYNLEKGRIKKFLIYIVCASLIHLSAILFLLFLLIPLFAKDRQNISARSQRLLSIAMIAAWAFSLFVMVTGGSLPWLNQFLGVALEDTSYEMYTEKADVGMEGQIHYVYNIFVLLSFFVNKREHIYLWIMFVLGGVLNNFSLGIPNITRLAYNFTIAFFIIVPYTCDKNNYSKKTGPFIEVLMIFTILYYTRELVFNHILNPHELLGTKMYNFSDFFK